MASLPWLHRIHDYLLFYAESRPSQEAVVADGEALRYGELQDRVRACAAALIAAGVQRGDRVATLSQMRTEYLVTFLASAMIGAIWMGLNPRYRRQELEHILQDARPRILFTITRFGERNLVAEFGLLFSETVGSDRVVALDRADESSGGSTTFARFLESGHSHVAASELERRACAVQARDPVLLVYTSGTTGRPKGALLTHEGLIGRAFTQNQTWPCDPIRVVNFLPINHIGGVGFISIYCLVGGGTQFLQPSFDAGELLSLLERQQITIWIGLPTIFLMVLEQLAFDVARLRHLQWAVWSGAAMPIGTVRTLRAIGCRIASSYGLTESSGSVCYAPSDLDDETLARTIGRATPPGEVRLADAEGRPVPRGVPGEIQIRPEWAMSHYLNLEQASAEARTSDGFIRSGDIGVEDEAGCIALVGRTKEMFKSGGYNVYPREVELAIEQHPDIAACAVVPIPDARFQEVGVAFVQRLTERSVPARELREWCSARLANYKVPKQFRFIAQLPMLGIGKIDRQALRALAEVRLEEEATAPRDGSGPVPLRSRANAEAGRVERTQ